MASISYLWAHRAKFSMASEKFYRSWAKRLLNLPELFKRNQKRNKLTRQGAEIHELAEIGKVVIQGKKVFLKIGKLSFVGNINIALHQEVVIGERVCINDGVEILTASHDVMDPEWLLIKKKIVIEDYVWIGTGATILPGVVIQRGAVVGAKAVVSKSVEAYSIVVGNPARAISKTRSQDLNYNPCEFIAANQAWLIG